MSRSNTVLSFCFFLVCMVSGCGGGTASPGAPTRVKASFPRVTLGVRANGGRQTERCLVSRASGAIQACSKIYVIVAPSPSLDFSSARSEEAGGSNPPSSITFQRRYTLFGKQEILVLAI